MRRLLLATTTALSLVLAGCLATGGAAPGGEARPVSTQPTMATITTIMGIQTFLTLQQTKLSTQAASAKTPAEAEKLRGRAAAAANIMANLTPLRTEINCQRRMQLATAVANGLQTEFPNYQAELSLGTNLANILVTGMPGCQ